MSNEGKKGIREFAFDIKLLGVCRVKAENEARARALLADYGDGIDIGLTIAYRENMNEGEVVSFTEASIDGKPDLFEVDGKATEE